MYRELLSRIIHQIIRACIVYMSSSPFVNIKHKMVLLDPFIEQGINSTEFSILYTQYFNELVWDPILLKDMAIIAVENKMDKFNSKLFWIGKDR